MIRIPHVHGQDVTEDGSGLIEGDAVVLEIRRYLLRIPFEAVRHLGILTSSRSFRKLIGITFALSRGAYDRAGADGSSARLARSFAFCPRFPASGSPTLMKNRDDD